MRRKTLKRVDRYAFVGAIVLLACIVIWVIWYEQDFGIAGLEWCSRM